jgi:hypothetical protein
VLSLKLRILFEIAGLQICPAQHLPNDWSNAANQRKQLDPIGGILYPCHLLYLIVSLRDTTLGQATVVDVR